MSEIDLSSEIAASIGRKTGEQVTCRRVAPNHYRCNWWSLRGTSAFDNPAMLGSLVTTSRICRSQFLRAVKSGSELSIAVISSDGAQETTAAVS